MPSHLPQEESARSGRGMWPDYLLADEKEIPQPPSRGFSLLELLVAISIITIIVGVAAPAMNSSLRGSQLIQGASMITEQLILARQTALSKNRSMEVRFYQYVEPGSGNQDSRFSAMQTFEIQESGSAVALEKMRLLPSSIIIDSGTMLSTLLGTSQAKNWTPPLDSQVRLPRIGTSYVCRAFRFLPGGSTDLAQTNGSWFLTLHSAKEGDGLQTPPANFYCIRVDAGNGHIQTYQP